MGIDSRLDTPLVYSEIHDRMLNADEIECYCEGCETPLIEDDLESGNCVFTNSGSTFCHADCADSYWG